MYNRFEKVGDLIVKTYFEGDCKLGDEDKETLKKIANFITKLTNDDLTKSDFKALICYGRELENNKKYHYKNHFRQNTNYEEESL